MKRFNWLVGSVVVVGLTACSYAIGKSSALREVSTPAAQLKWAPMMPNVPNGPQVAPLWGDPSKGANGFLLKLPPGAKSGWHTHSNTYKAVVLQGTMSNASADELKPVQLAEGSYYMTPGTLAHHNECLAGSECIVYIHYDKKQDYQPAPEP